ncbi:MAG: 16S rRNA (guanine(527)-N(7))-methyltransferase RsmG [Thermoanaerobaculales bacterium]|nr:16S rRNA (guanine(527)-N(7))-methyltransferase RsmG [Thermoanaerobaculales bacterium]
MTRETTYEGLLRGKAPEQSVERLALYAAHLERWSKRHNLVRFAGRRELVNRHLLEALAAVAIMPPRGKLVDIGSGGGLPGIPLLCVREAWSGVLVEPRQKRWAFLKMMVRELGLKAEVERVRFQDLAVENIDLITVRAVGGYPGLLAWARPRLAPMGKVAIWGTEAEEERLGRLEGWRVLSSGLIGLDRGRLIQVQVCST